MWAREVRLKRNLSCWAIQLCLVLACSGSCKRESLGRDPVRLSPLRVLATIRPHPPSVISGAIGTTDCGILLADLAAGEIVSMAPDGASARVIARMTGRYREPIRLEPYSARRAIVWTAGGDLLAFVDVRTGQLDSVRIPIHRWGGRLLGPLAGESGRAIAMAPLGDAAWPKAKPRGAPPSPMVMTLPVGGGRSSDLGAVADDGRDEYSPWLKAASAVGFDRGTILVVNLFEAVLYRFNLQAGGGWTSSPDSTRLPRYFEAEQPQEHRVRVAGKEYIGFSRQPHFEAGAFDAEGRFYGIRNYSPPGTRSPARPVVRPAPTRGLEIYASSGELLGSFRLPTSNPSWIRADGRGRLLIMSGSSGGDPELLVAENPATRSQCQQSVRSRAWTYPLSASSGVGGH